MIIGKCGPDMCNESFSFDYNETRREKQHKRFRNVMNPFSEESWES